MQESSTFSTTILNQKYAMTKEDGTKETWDEICYRVSTNVFKAVGLKKNSPIVKDAIRLMQAKKWFPGGRYLYATGRPYHQTQNCLLLKAKDSREGWAELIHNATLALMTGAGIGVVYSDIRAEGKIIRKTGGTSTGPIALMQMINEAGRGIMQGGSRRSAIWAGLNWNHPDILKFIHIKDWSKEVIDLKSKNFNFPATLDGTNVSVMLDDLFFEAYHSEEHQLHSHASSVYWAVIENMLKTGEPGFSIDVKENKDETLRNACVTGDTLIDVLIEDEYQKIDVRTLVSLMELNKNIKIKSYNPKTKIFEFKEVEWAGLTKKKAKIIQIKDLKTQKILRCTPDHLILTQRGYIEAKDLLNIDELIIDI